ncbi:hypothetical protein GUJ93_ZPchr0010g10635 [Zizania palustris]|uniref:Uncharacterized protein n=1 Tax=Zizania palustris TaxID=103762 RepID=A0A8J6BN79_ZIZPA|nr:hypothetical protein GUJ93_ZPchr0010g10635 [Zizania palustris]
MRPSPGKRPSSRPPDLRSSPSPAAACRLCTFSPPPRASARRLPGGAAQVVVVARAAAAQAAPARRGGLAMPRVWKAPAVSEASRRGWQRDGRGVVVVGVPEVGSDRASLFPR